MVLTFERCVAAQGKKGGGGDKVGAFFSAIRSEKLDTVRYSLTHGALSVTIEDDEGHTPLVLAAAAGKHRSLEQMLQILQRQRVLRDYVDIRDEEGRTPLMFAAANGNVSCVEVLAEFGASQTAKCEKGNTARDYAVKKGRDKVLEFFDYVSSEEEEGDEAVPNDGLTSTERSKLKKEAAKARENRGRAGGDEEDDAAKLAEEMARLEAAQEASEQAKGTAVWEELKALSHMEGKDVREVTLLKVEEEQCVPGADGGVDPALWRCEFLNRVQLQMPPGRLVALPDAVAGMKGMEILILSKNALQALPEAIGELKNLRVLEVDANALESVPVALGNMPKLELLNLSQNSLTTLAPLAEGGALPNLLTFNCDFNQLETLELPFGSMARINSLSVANNKMTTLDEGMGLLQGSLATLNLSHNELTSLAAIRDLKDKKLKALNVDENPFADKKVFKLLRNDKQDQIIKELLKYLQKQGPDGGGGGGGKKV